MARTREIEAEAVKTTIVGGRPPGSGRANVMVPRGIEVLVKKAAVDPEFRDLLLGQRGRAATDIGLELDPAESAMLGVIPKEHLARIIDQTEVATELRPAFSGRAGALMLAALGAGLVSNSLAKPAGVQGDQPQGSTAVSEVVTNTPASNPPTPVASKRTISDLAAFTNSAPVTVLGVRINPPPGWPPSNQAPPVVVFGVRVTPPTNPPPTNSPSTNPPPAPVPRNVIRGIQPTQPPVIIAGVMAPVPPPLTNAAPTNASPTNAALPAQGRNVYSTTIVVGVRPVPPPDEGSNEKK
jgi:hypothetical protein